MLFPLMVVEMFVGEMDLSVPMVQLVLWDQLVQGSELVAAAAVAADPMVVEELPAVPSLEAWQ